MSLRSNWVWYSSEEEASPVIFGTLSKDIVTQLDISMSAKEFLKTKHVEAAHVVKARVQALQLEFETIFMGEEKSVLDFAAKLYKVII